MGSFMGFFKKMLVVSDEEDENEIEEAYTDEPAVKSRKRYREEESVENIRPERKIYRKNQDFSSEPFQQPEAPRVKKSVPREQKIVPISTPTAFNPGSVRSCKPTKFNDAMEICDLLKDGFVVVVNLEGIQSEIGQRVMDIVCGLVYALEGNARKISLNVFVMTPKGIDISGDFVETIEGIDLFGIDRGF